MFVDDKNEPRFFLGAFSGTYILNRLQVLNTQTKNRECGFRKRSFVRFVRNEKSDEIFGNMAAATQDKEQSLSPASCDTETCQ